MAVESLRAKSAAAPSQLSVTANVRKRRASQAGERASRAWRAARRFLHRGSVDRLGSRAGRPHLLKEIVLGLNETIRIEGQDRIEAGVPSEVNIAKSARPEALVTLA